MDGWMEVKAVLRIAYSNQKHSQTVHKNNKNEQLGKNSGQKI